MRSNRVQPTDTPNFLKYFLQRKSLLVFLSLATLLFSVFFFLIKPDNIKDLLIPDSYFMMIVVWWIFLWSILAVFLQHLRRGAMVAGMIVVITIFQAIEMLNLMALLLSVVPLLLLEVSLTVLSRR